MNTRTPSDIPTTRPIRASVLDVEEAVWTVIEAEVVLFPKLPVLVAAGTLSVTAGVIGPVNVGLLVGVLVVERVANAVAEAGHSASVAALHTTSPFAKTGFPAR